MPSVACTPEVVGGKWVLYRKATGQRITRWPVDARGMLAAGEFTAVPPTGDATAAPVSAPPEHPPEGAGPTAAAMPAPLPAEYAPGVPLSVTRAHEAAPGQPLAEPVHTKGKRAR